MNNQTMGAMVAALSKEKGMTQADLAARMGVTDKAVSKWERDLSLPDVHSIPKLAQVLGISVEELMGSAAPSGEGRKPLQPLVLLVVKAVALAMGVSVTVLSILGNLSLSTGFILLGIGLTCVGICLLQEKNRPGQ